MKQKLYYKTVSSKFQKKILYRTFFLLFLTYFSVTKSFAQNSFSLSPSELSGVVQSCLDMPDMQKYYPVNSDGSLKQINIKQYPISFPTDLNVEKSEQSINYILISTPETVNIDGYFAFRRIQNSTSSLMISFNYFYNCNSPITKSITVNAEFEKTTTGWNLINSTFNGDTL